MQGLGTGIYTPAEAAILLHEKPSTINRWAFGYSRNRSGGPTQHPPLIHTDLPEVEGKRALSFVELIELLYIRAFEQAGASWKIIKEAANVAARIAAQAGNAQGSVHPFALRHLYVDPAGLLYVVLKETKETDAVVLLKGHGQHNFPELVRPYLEQIDFDVNDVATRWWPLGKHGGVSIDPAFAFGAPMVEEIGIKTKTLSDTYFAELDQYGERTLEHVAWLYEISPRHVETALNFKKWLIAQA
jgi:hypothetical protein